MVRFGRMPAYLSIGALLALGASRYATKQRTDREDSVAVYDIKWQKPAGWNELPHSPQSLFLYQDPRTHILIRGALNQVISDTNPSPELDSNGLADYYLATTQENMPNWKGEKIEGDQGQGVDFAVIRRKREGKTVVTAFGVRGNTTLIMTLSGKAGEQKDIQAIEPVFRESLHNISFHRRVLAMR